MPCSDKEGAAYKEWEAYVRRGGHGESDGIRALVRISRFVDKPNAEDVRLEVGDRIVYKREQPVVSATIESEFSKSTEGHYGYVARFDDDGQLAFAGEQWIIDWPGKGAAGR